MAKHRKRNAILNSQVEKAPSATLNLSSFPVQVMGVALAALLVNLPVLNNPLLFDDRALLVESTWLHDVRNWVAIASSPYWPPPWEPDLYRPLTSVLLAAQHSTGGGGRSSG